jgi:AAA family ATP:ADP antiporter
MTLVSLIRRVFGSIFSIRRDEAPTAGLMFVYSFLAMTGYNVLRPITRSKFISALGADNLPYVLLIPGVLIAVLMQGSSRATSLIPRRWAIPSAQLAISAILVVFWFLFGSDAVWISVAFYVFGLTLGILLISQFWTLANDIYDSRQARRVFGIIGGGASLGGASGAAITALTVSRVGSDNLLLVSALAIAACAGIVAAIVRRQPAYGASETGGEEAGVGGAEAIRLLAQSRHLQLISVVIGFAAIGAAIVDQQLNMAAESMKGADATDAITGFLAQVSFYLSIAVIVQVALTSQIHRALDWLSRCDPAGRTRRDGGADPRDRRVVGAGRGARARHLDPLHDRQDHAGGAVSAAARRREVPREAIHRRHDGSARQSERRPVDPGADQAVGIQPVLAVAQLREPLSARVAPLDRVGRGRPDN